MSGYDKVKAARSSYRLTSSDFIYSKSLFTEFCEMHGDRAHSDDSAVIAGIALLGEVPVTVIGLEKGHGTNDRIARNFGSAYPDGYRKALRQMKLAEKFRRPIICFIDTSGAFCGIQAEEGGQGYAIAQNLYEMMTLETVIISIIIGEGGSGGALGLAVANEVWMLENAYYSVVSPEGCASILWKDAARAPEAADYLKLTAPDLLKLGVIERIIEEDSAQLKLFASLNLSLTEKINALTKIDTQQLLNMRYEKFRKIGEF